MKHFNNCNLDYSVLATYDLPVNEEANSLAEQMLNDEQRNKLVLLQQRLEKDFPDHISNTCSLLRFLRARKFDLDKAEYMYRERMQWVNDYKPHMISRKDVESELRLGALLWHSSDANGRPVLIFKARKFFPIEGDTNHDKIWRYFVYVVENSLKKLALPPHDQVVILNDREGATSANNDMAGFRRLVKLADYYPEVLGDFITIHPNAIFKIIVTMLKPFLDVATQKKLHMLKSKTPSLIAEELTSRFNFSRDRVDELLQEHGGKQIMQDCVHSMMVLSDVKKLHRSEPCASEDLHQMQEVPPVAASSS